MIKRKKGKQHLGTDKPTNHCYIHWPKAVRTHSAFRRTRWRKTRPSPRLSWHTGRGKHCLAILRKISTSTSSWQTQIRAQKALTLSYTEDKLFHIFYVKYTREHISRILYRKNNLAILQKVIPQRSSRKISAFQKAWRTNTAPCIAKNDLTKISFKISSSEA